MPALARNIDPENHYCMDLDLGFNIDYSIIDELSTKVDPQRRNQLDINHRIDTKLQEFVYHRGLYITHAEAFYTPPFTGLGIHIDGKKADDHCKLNFVWGGEGSIMQWWRPINPDSSLPGQTPIDTDYLRYHVTDCELVYEAQIGQPSLVNAGRPHSIYNQSHTGRWCMSYVLRWIKGKSLLQWAEAVDKFQHFAA